MFVFAVGGQHRAGPCLPTPFSRSISIPPQISPPHQNTPNGKKIWHEEGGGRRPPLTVFNRAEPPAEHGLEDPQGQRVRRAKTTGHKANLRQRSCGRLAALKRDSSSACGRQRGAQGPGGGRRTPGLYKQLQIEADCWSHSSASSLPSAPAE